MATTRIPLIKLITPPTIAIAPKLLNESIPTIINITEAATTTQPKKKRIDLNLIEY